MKKTKTQLNILPIGAIRNAYNSFVLETMKHGEFEIVRWAYDENRVPRIDLPESYRQNRINDYKFSDTVLKRKGIFKRKYQIDSLSEGKEEEDSPLVNCSTETSILEKILNFPLNLLIRMWPSDGPIGAPEFIKLVGVDYDFLRKLYNSGKKTFEANYFLPLKFGFL